MYESYREVSFITVRVRDHENIMINSLEDRSSYKGRMVNALASGVEEGRDKLRKAWGRRT